MPLRVQLLDDHLDVPKVEDGGRRANNDVTGMDHSEPMGIIDPSMYDKAQRVDNKKPNVYDQGLGSIGDNDNMDTDGVFPVANSPTAPKKHAHDKAPIPEPRVAQPDTSQNISTARRQSCRPIPPSMGRMYFDI
jgi:hypothetical protein